MELEKDKPRFSKTNVHTCLRSMIRRMKKRGKILAAIDERVPSLKVTRKQYKTGPSVQFYTLASPITFAIILHCAAFFMAHRFPRENHECVS